MIKIEEIVVGNKFIRRGNVIYTSNIKTMTEDDRVIQVKSVRKNICDITLTFLHIKSSCTSTIEICTESSQRITDYLDEYEEPIKTIEPKPRLSFIE